MQNPRRRAVIAAAMPDEAQLLRGMLERAGFSEILCVSDGLSALKQAQDAATDLLVADAVLPVLDGRMLAKRIAEASLPVYPAAVLLAYDGMCPGDAADCVLAKPVSEEKLTEVVLNLAPERRKIPTGKCALALKTLEDVGIPEHCGRDYLVRAVEMAWLDSRLLRALTARLYPAVAEEFQAETRHVIRAMRHVIDEAWRSGEMEAQYKIFGDTIDARRGSPTTGEMIARIADILRWEGRA